MGTFSQSLIPAAHDTYDIGSPEKRWKHGHFEGIVRSWEYYTRTIRAIEKQNLDLTVQTPGRGIGLANEIVSWVEIRPQGRPQSLGQKFDSNPFTIVSAYWDSASNRREQLELFIQVKQAGIPDGYVVFNFRRTYPEDGVIEWTSDFLKVNHGEGFPRIPAGKLYLEGAYGELQFWESDSSKWIVAKRESAHGTQPNRLIFSFFDGANWKEMLHLDPLNNRLIPGASNLDIGSAANPWRNLIINGYGNIGSLQIGGTPVITSGRILQNIASVGCNLIPDANLTRDLGSATVAWNRIYTGYGYIGRLTVTDQIKDNSDTYQMARILRYSGTSRNTPAWVFFPATSDYSLLPTTSDYGYIGESDRRWWQLWSTYGYHYYCYPRDGDNTGYLGGSTRRWAYLYALNKSSAFKHPLNNPQSYIVFKCVESPKVTVEDWGIAQLKDGVAFVGLSEEFVALMSDNAEYAVFLTPEGECNGLYVSKKEFYGFEVRELMAEKAASASAGKSKL
jgi:hypothetical protein